MRLSAISILSRNNETTQVLVRGGSGIFIYTITILEPLPVGSHLVLKIAHLMQGSAMGRVDQMLRVPAIVNSIVDPFARDTPLSGSEFALTAHRRQFFLALR